MSAFSEFRNSGEGIATDVPSNRLRKLKAAGILWTEADPADRRQVNCRLTENGTGLAPVLLKMFVWAARAGRRAMRMDRPMEREREGIWTEARRRWKERDLTPLPPAPARAGRERGKR